MVHMTFSQSGGMYMYNSYGTVARDLWQRKLPLSSVYTLRLRSVYFHTFKSLALCYTTCVQHVPEYLIQYQCPKIRAWHKHKSYFGPYSIFTGCGSRTMSTVAPKVGMVQKFLHIIFYFLPCPRLSSHRSHGLH